MCCVSWVHIFKHSLFRLKITVGCQTRTYLSIHIETPSRSRSVACGAHIRAFTFLLTKTLSRSRSVVWCVVWCACGACGVWVVCGVGGVVVWWRVCVVCGEAWHALSLALSLFFLFSLLLNSLSFLPLLFPFLFLSHLSFFSLLYLFLSSFSFSFALAPSLALSFFSSHHQTLFQEPINQQISRRSNVTWHTAAALLPPSNRKKVSTKSAFEDV